MLPWLVGASVALSAVAAVAATVAAGLVTRLIRAFERAAAAELSAASEAAEPSACVHAEDRRTDMSTMGRERWSCDPRKGGCGFEINRERARSSAAGATS